MNFLKITLGLSLLFTLSAQAIEQSDRRCVSQAPATVHSWLVNYDNYKNIDDGIRLHIPGLGDRQVINMIQSSRTRFVDTQEGSTGFVWVMLTPMNVSDQLMWPRFMLGCQSTWVSYGSEFTHSCNLLSENNLGDMDPSHSRAIHKNFGLSRFSSTLRARAITPENASQSVCRPGQTELNYQFVITADETQVNLIKDAAVDAAFAGIRNPFPSLVETVRGAVRNLFGDSFFGWYYQEFYNAWATQIR